MECKIIFWPETTNVDLPGVEPSPPACKTGMTAPYTSGPSRRGSLSRTDLHWSMNPTSTPVLLPALKTLAPTSTLDNKNPLVLREQPEAPELFFQISAMIEACIADTIQPPITWFDCNMSRVTVCIGLLCYTNGQQC